MLKYGRFSKDRREFIITRPDTPAPWVNYISNGRYSGLISHTGGGYSFFRSPKDSRITRWRYNSLPVDRPGRYILLRHRDDGEYWSPTWQPTVKALQRFECRHALYSTRISSRYRDVEASIRYFVPDEDLELWTLTVRNEGTRRVDLDLFAFQELALGHALVDLINQPNDQHFNEVMFEPDTQILYASKRYWVRYNGPTVKQANESWDRWAFFASSLPVKGWDGSKADFIGRWRSEANPVAVEEGRCRNTDITAGDAIAALQTDLRLDPGEERTVTFMLGVVPRTEPGRAKIWVEKYRQPESVEAAYTHLQQFWDHYLNAISVETPDEDMNTMLNVWNPYQTSVTFQFSRDASYYHGGLLFGRGYRDSCQDIMGPVIPRPDWVRSRILEMCHYQFSDGSVFHLYHPLTGGGERTGHSDTPLWLPLAVMTYLKETGDFALLEERTRFFDTGDATILEHILAAVDYTLANLTKRGLAKFGPGDWNDTLDYLGREGRGESIWVTQFLAYILKEIIDLSKTLDRPEQQHHYEKEYQMVASAINEYAWDGNWYIRGTTDSGQIVGSSINREGRIFLNTQTWAVISGIADPERAELCMKAVKEHLDTPKGPKILDPAYRTVNQDIGLATRCVPGKKENGAVFNHPVSWAILAECLLGNGDRAFDLYKRALPMNPVIAIDRYEVEPYVYAEYVTSPDHPTYGQASHSWLTGSSTWMLRDGLDYILGVRPTYNGLLIDPCIPRQWGGFHVQRRYREKDYDIRVTNPDRVNTGVRHVRINDTPIEGRLLDLDNPAIRSLVNQHSTVRLDVVMG
jgi:cellobiose phosphorylase